MSRARRSPYCSHTMGGGGHCHKTTRHESGRCAQHREGRNGLGQPADAPRPLRSTPVADIVPPAAGQLRLLPDGRELFVRSDPRRGVVRGRLASSVATFTERGNESTVERISRLPLLAEGQCFMCWRTGTDEGHEPAPYARPHHAEVRGRRLTRRDEAARRKEARNGR